MASKQYIPRALFAVSSLGLGHATRSLPIIQYYLKNDYKLTIISAGNALTLLKAELYQDASKIEFQEWTDYPPLERGTGWKMYFYLIIDLLKTAAIIRKEHRKIQPQISQYDFIFSDGRYGIYSSLVPSFILSHQISFIPPKWLMKTREIITAINLWTLRHFTHIFIPDFSDSSISLAGALSHTKKLAKYSHTYIGILSSYPTIPRHKDIDYLFILSGYLLEHKNSLLISLMEQAIELKKSVVFILGDPNIDLANFEPFFKNGLTIYPIATGPLRDELFSRAKCIISRSGYTTIMDLIEHQKKALLIPTPNQTEQEYLAQYLNGHHYFTTRLQKPCFNLKEALNETKTNQPFPTPWSTQQSIRKLAEQIRNSQDFHYFSIVIPAHNEENELIPTLQCLFQLQYPCDHWEIILVENGSQDKTLDVIHEMIVSAPNNLTIKVFQSPQGVSKARNMGLQNTDPQSEWVIFCDADTRIKPFFLKFLNHWINQHKHDYPAPCIGTTSISPHPNNHWYSRFWFKVFNLTHKWTHTSFAVQIAKTDIAKKIEYDENLHLAEDLKFIKEAKKFGSFFYLAADDISTSTRRFAANGYFRQSLIWIFYALIPPKFQSKRPYNVVR